MNALKLGVHHRAARDAVVIDLRERSAFVRVLLDSEVAAAAVQTSRADFNARRQQNRLGQHHWLWRRQLCVPHHATDRLRR